MKKSFIIAIAVIVIVAVIAIVVLLLMKNNGGTTGGGIGGGTTGGNLPPVSTSTGPGTGGGTTTPPTGAPTGATFQIGTNQGSVTVNNIYKKNQGISDDKQTIILAQTGNYGIDYSTPDSGFSIAITYVGDNLQAVRDAAENDFLSTLGVSKADACKLNVNEGVTDKTSDYYGETLGLSFCGQGIAPGQ